MRFIDRIDLKMVLMVVPSLFFSRPSFSLHRNSMTEDAVVQRCSTASRGSSHGDEGLEGPSGCVGTVEEAILQKGASESERIAYSAAVFKEWRMDAYTCMIVQHLFMF